MLRYYFYDALQGNLPLTSRKPLQPDSTKHTDEEDSCSVASSYPFATLVPFSFFFFPLHFLVMVISISLTIVELQHL